MKLKILSANANVKCSIQSTGRLGFSLAANKKLDIKTGQYFVIATNAEDSKDENLYGWIEATKDNGGFRINKAGTYFNLNTKSLFDSLGVDYKSKSTVTIFDIVNFENGDKHIYKLIKRVQKRIKKHQLQ